MTMNNNPGRKGDFFSRDKIRSIGITLVVAIIVLFGGLWLLFGYESRLESEPITGGEGLVIDLPAQVDTDTFTLYINQEKFLVEGTKEMITKELKPGTYRVILATADRTYQPWMKNITITDNKTITLDPFLTKIQSQSVVHKKSTNPELYEELHTKLERKSKASVATSSDGTVRVRHASGTIALHWLGEEPAPLFFCENAPKDASCPDSKTIYSGKSIVGSANFFPGRNDVIIFSNKSGIYALEASAREPQNFHKIYRGTPAVVAVWDGSIYFQDKRTRNIIIEIPLTHQKTKSAPRS